ncbi:MAG: P-II family nitrogen regulator [Acidimicrobiia bacterium]
MTHLITAVIKPHKVGDVKDALKAAGALGLTISEVQGFGRQGGKSETFRGSEYTVEFVPKVKLEVLVDSDKLDATIDALAAAAHTGKIGDGTVWAVELDRLQRVRTGETGIDAL